MLRALLALALVVFLGACSQEPKVNAKDQASYEHSVQMMMSQMEPKQQMSLELALRAILFADISNLEDLMQQDEHAMRAKFYERIDGKTSEQIIALAVKMRGQKTSSAPINPRAAAVTQ